jgi:hypothetical protein
MICFVTSTVKNTDAFPTRVNRIPDAHYWIFVTDMSRSYPGWDPILIPHDDRFLSIARHPHIYQSRYGKFMAWDYFRRNGAPRYDAIVWCDAYMYPDHTKNWREMVSLVKNHGLIQVPHCRDAIKECDAITILRKDTAEAMRRMKDLLSLHRYKPDIITANTFFIYDPQNNQVVNAMEAFWNEYLDRHITYRDQPLWALIRQKHHLSYFSFKDLKSYFVKSKMLYTVITII